MTTQAKTKRIVKTVTYHALDPDGDVVFSCSVERERLHGYWAVYDPETGKTISEHRTRAGAMRAAKRECREYLR